MNILVRGEQPFRLLRRVDDLAYPAGDIEMLEDDGMADDDQVNAVRITYADVVERATERRPDADDLDGMDAYGMAATIELDPGLKQQLLDCRSEDQRLEMVEALFTKAVERLDKADEVADAARSNGKVHL